MKCTTIGAGQQRWDSRQVLEHQVEGRLRLHQPVQLHHMPDTLRQHRVGVRRVRRAGALHHHLPETHTRKYTNVLNTSGTGHYVRCVGGTPNRLTPPPAPGHHPPRRDRGKRRRCGGDLRRRILRPTESHRLDPVMGLEGTTDGL